MTALRLFVKEDGPYAQHRGRYREVDNGPFPITREQLDAARHDFRAEWDACEPLSGIRQSPQTAARDILKQHAPQLSSFDAAMVGFAVAALKIRVQEEP